MRLVTLLFTSLLFAASAQAQMSQRSSNPNGVQIQGNTSMKASQENAAAVAQGEGNVANNTAGAIKAGTQIQGNTRINAAQKNATVIASGRGNTSGNEAGQIGDSASASPVKERACQDIVCKRGSECPSICKK